MAIVTISRGTLSGGQHLAECLGHDLGYRVVSREVLAEAARRYGVDESDLVRGLDQPPSFWDRFKIDRQVYLAAVQAALCRMVKGDSVVYHGHAGHLLLKDIDNVLRVRVIAPLSQRVGAARSVHGFSDREAEVYIQKNDAQRVAWTRFLYGVEWRDPSLYDLVFNLEKVTISTACAAIAAIVERPEYRTTPGTLQKLEDLYLASHIRAMLFLNGRLGAAIAKIEVTAADGVVRLVGVVPSQEQVDEILEVCRTVPEVKRVDSKWLGSHVEPV